MGRDEEIARALQGNRRDEHLFALKQTDEFQRRQFGAGQLGLVEQFAEVEEVLLAGAPSIFFQKRGLLPSGNRVRYNPTTPTPKLLLRQPTLMNPNLANGNASKGQSANRSNSAANTDLANTVRTLRGRTPRESLGADDQHGLFRPFLLASVVTALVFVALTAGPYFLNQSHSTAAIPAKPVPTEGTDVASPTPPPSQPNPEVIAKKTSDNPAVTVKPPAKKDLMNILGESGTKTGNPNVDELLKDLK